MNVVYLGLFLIVTVLHLIGSLKKDETLRNTTKGMILLTILGFYLETRGIHSGILIAAILMSWAGDMLLICQRRSFFVAGGLSFLISHILYIIAYIYDTDFHQVPVWVILISAALFLTGVYYVLQNLREELPENMFAPMWIYLGVNGLMNCFAFCRYIADPGHATLITVIGSILFFISDVTLYYVRFRESCRFDTHFCVMLTYSAGEFLIVLGMLLHVVA